MLGGIRVLDADYKPLLPGEEGELEISGPQVVPGYWKKPEATDTAMPEGRLRTGDVAIIDEAARGVQGAATGAHRRRPPEDPERQDPPQRGP